MNEEVIIEVSPLEKPYKREHRKKEHRPPPRRNEADLSRRNPGTMWQRIQGDLENLVRSGLDPNMGTVIGRLFVFSVITERQVAAALLYAEIRGRYARYHAEGRRNAVSPAFQRGFRGYDNEVQKHTENGTLRTYERRANRAEKAWIRMQRCIPPHQGSQDMIDQVCLDNQEIASIYHADLIVILDKISREFFGRQKE